MTAPALMTLAGGLAMGVGLYGLLFARRRGWMPAVIQGGASVGLLLSYVLMSMKPPHRDEAPAVVGPTYTLFAIAAVLAFLVATWMREPPPTVQTWRRRSPSTNGSGESVRPSSTGQRA
jgi:hypothetical protein